MAFLAKADVQRYLDTRVIDQLTDTDDTIVADAIADAEDRVREKISPRFDLDIEFAKTGPLRNRSLLKCCISLSIYYLYERLNTQVLPEAKVTAFEIAEHWLNEVYEGKLSVNLAKVDETNKTGWPMRWGSYLKKGNQSY